MPVQDFERCANELHVIIKEQGFLSGRGRIRDYGPGSGRTVSSELP